MFIFFKRNDNCIFLGIIPSFKLIGIQFLGMLCTKFFLENCFRKLLLNLFCRKVLPRIMDLFIDFVQFIFCL